MPHKAVSGAVFPQQMQGDTAARMSAVSGHRGVSVSSDVYNGHSTTGNPSCRTRSPQNPPAPITGHRLRFCVGG